MGHEKRKHIRTPFVCHIKIQHQAVGELVVKTRDISDGGVFVVLEPELVPPIGSHLMGQVQGIADDAPVLKMEVVRVETTGVGLRFIEQES